jgi:hypothetical protein
MVRKISLNVNVVEKPHRDDDGKITNLKRPHKNRSLT